MMEVRSWMKDVGIPTQHTSDTYDENVRRSLFQRKRWPLTKDCVDQNIYMMCLQTVLVWYPYGDHSSSLAVSRTSRSVALPETQKSRPLPPSESPWWWCGWPPQHKALRIFLRHLICPVLLRVHNSVVVIFRTYQSGDFCLYMCIVTYSRFNCFWRLLL